MQYEKNKRIDEKLLEKLKKIISNKNDFQNITVIQTHNMVQWTYSLLATKSINN